MFRLFMLVKVISTALLLLAVGCVDSDGPSLFVQGNGIFDDECMIDPSSPDLLLSGIFDVSGGTSYSVKPIFRNSLVNLSSVIGKTDPNWVQVGGAVVTLTQPGGTPINFGDLANPFTVDMSTTVPSAVDATAPGAAVGEVAVIPANYAAVLSPLIPAGSSTTVVARIQFVGQTLGETEVESSEWRWPVTVCSDCAQVCSLSARTFCRRCQDGEGCPIAAVPPCQCLTSTDCAGGGTCNAGICE